MWSDAVWLVLTSCAGSNVSAYIGMVGDSLRNTLPKAAVHCQVREAKRSLLDHFYTQIGKREVHMLCVCTYFSHGGGNGGCTFYDNALRYVVLKVLCYHDPVGPGFSARGNRGM